MDASRTITVGVLALQGGFAEHMTLLREAFTHLDSTTPVTDFETIEVRNATALDKCDALIIPGGESTTMSLVAKQCGILEPLRNFVKVQKKPVWGTCAGLIFLSEEASATKRGGQELIGGLDVRVHRNHFGRQIESFETCLDLEFLGNTASSSPDQSTVVRPFLGVFIRAPVIEGLLPSAREPQSHRPPVTILARLPSKMSKGTKSDSGDIIAVRQGNVMGMSFHPELTTDARIHIWWLKEILESALDSST